MGRGSNICSATPRAGARSWTCTTGASPDASGLGIQWPALKRRMLGLWPGAQPVLQGLVDPLQLRVARYADVGMPHWHAGSVVAIGDFAHAMSPQLGQGANMALIDALTLAEQLQHGARLRQPLAQSLAAYSRVRRRHLKFYQRASRWLTPLFQSHARLGPALRDTLFGVGGRLPLVERESIAALAGIKGGWWPSRVGLPKPVFQSPALANIL
jgi:2-polyprenyl-6-methoxyphenol hydroxylase-like FAD-dependent oxidoreductase